MTSGRTCAIAWVAAAGLATASHASEGSLGLTGAVLEALEANPDLASRRRALAADRESIALRRAALLPQIAAGAQGQILDSDRSDDSRGFVSQRSATLFAGVSQVLYDVDDWANFEIQKYVYDQQTQQFESFRLGIVQEAALAFLELDRARAALDTQQQNRELTRRNLEIARQRVGAGWSGESDELRWQSQLAANDTAVVQAQSRELSSRFQLNRLRNRGPEEPVEPLPATLEQYGWLYARDGIVRELSDADAERRLRDWMVQEALPRSPRLAAVDAAIEAAERQLQADRQVFWIPTLTVGAGVDHAFLGSSQNPAFNETEWGARGTLSIPLLEGGGRFAALRQTRETLASLRLERRAQVLALGEGIRASFAQASAGYASLRFAQQQETAARRYFEIVTASYEAGVASILRLLDAQNQLLNASLGVVDARYAFLEDLIDAERQMALYPFLEPEREMSRMLDQLEVRLRDRP